MFRWNNNIKQHKKCKLDYPSLCHLFRHFHPALDRAQRLRKGFHCISSSTPEKLGSETDIDAVDTPTKTVSLEGVELDTTQKQLNLKWGSPDFRFKKGNLETLNFKKYGATIYLKKDKITQIKITDSISFKLSNKIKIGSKITDVQKLLGKKAKRQGNYLTYSGKTKLALRFINGLLQEIVMYR